MADGWTGSYIVHIMQHAPTQLAQKAEYFIHKFCKQLCCFPLII